VGAIRDGKSRAGSATSHYALIAALTHASTRSPIPQSAVPGFFFSLLL
jgi:hypothetical protein